MVKKTKAMLFIAMVCLMFVGAGAQIESYTTYKQPVKAINIDGLSGGQISIMTTSGEQAKPVVNTNVGKYVNGYCQSATQWKFNNAIDFKSGKKFEGDYRLNLQTCQVEKLTKEEVWSMDGSIDKPENHKHSWINGTRTKVPDYDYRTKLVWTPVDLNAPVQ